MRTFCEDIKLLRADLQDKKFKSKNDGYYPKVLNIINTSMVKMDSLKSASDEL